MRARYAIAIAFFAAGVVRAQDAQDELERQLKEMVGKPPTKLLIEFEGLDQPQYKLSEASFELDGSTLPAPSTEKLNGQGRNLIFHGDVKPGKHILVAKLSITDVAGALFSYEAGYTFKMAKSIAFDQQPGLEVQIRLEGELNPNERDKNKKWNVKANTQVKMLAKLEDGTMPDVPKPNLAKKDETPDAGVAVAELSPAEKAKILKEQQAEDARAKKQAAMEEAKRKKEEAAAAKAAAAEEKKRKREEALADARAKKEAAAAAKVAAAEEAKRKREGKPPKEPVEVANANPNANANANPNPTPEPAAEVVDAGAPAIAAAEPTPPKPTPAPAPTQAPESGGGFPLPVPVLIGVAVALLGLIIFVATRKKSPPAQF